MNYKDYVLLGVTISAVTVIVTWMYSSYTSTKSKKPSNEKESMFATLATSPATPHRSYFINLALFGNVEVKRAGAMIIVEQNKQYYTFAGYDVNSKSYCWFSGILEEKDGSVCNGVIREAFEESCGIVKLTQQDFDLAIKENRYFYDSSAKVFGILYLANDSSIVSLDAIRKARNIIENDNKICDSMKEMSIYCMVSMNQLSDLCDRLNKIGTNTNDNYDAIPKMDQNDSIFTVKNCQGQSISFDKYYAKSLAVGGGNNIIKKHFLK